MNIPGMESPCVLGTHSQHDSRIRQWRPKIERLHVSLRFAYDKAGCNDVVYRGLHDDK